MEEVSPKIVFTVGLHVIACRAMLDVPRELAQYVSRLLHSAAIRGCTELAEEIDIDFDVICCACGTGGTLAGISAGLKGDQQALGFSALKGGDFLTEDVAQLQRVSIGRVLTNWFINTEFHFGGFARRKPELDAFIDSFSRRHGLTLDWVYVAKMMYGIYTLADRGFFPRECRVIGVVTG